MKVPYDRKAILQLEKDNLLGLGGIKLYTIKTRERDQFAFYFAEHSLDVFGLHEEKFGEHDVFIHDADRLLSKLLNCAETAKEEFLFERKRRIAEYPA